MKKCSWCGILKPISDFYCFKNGVPKSHCKECNIGISRNYRNPKKYPILPDRQVKIFRMCASCNILKTLDQFSPKKRKGGKTGLQPYCKECNARKTKERNKKKPPKPATYDPEKNKAYYNRRKTRKIENGGNFTVEEWENLKQKYEYTCLCCHRSEPYITLTVDHVIPLCKGGSSSINNIQPLCINCNAQKHINVIDYRITFNV